MSEAPIHPFRSPPGSYTPIPSGQGPSARPGKKRLNCDNCGIPIERYPSQCKGATTCCSPECRAEIRKVRVARCCVVCGESFSDWPSRIGLLSTCRKGSCVRARKSWDMQGEGDKYRYRGLTMAEAMSQFGLTRNQVRYRIENGLSLGEDAA